MDGEDAGVVPKPFLDQNVEGPQRAGRDRIAGRAIAEDGDGPGRFEHAFGATQIVTKAARRLVVHEAVTVPMRSDLEAERGDAPDEVRPAFSDPAEHEKRRVDSGGIQNLQEPV